MRKSPPRTSRRKRKRRSIAPRKRKCPPPSPKFSARAKLVEVALAAGDREFFARAIVNRIWHRLFGHGLVMPLDQMHSANPPSHPELLAWLARDLAEHGYDLRRLIRGLVLSRAYARGSRWEAGDDPPRSSLFAVALVRPLAPDAACDVTPAGHRRSGEPARQISDPSRSRNGSRRLEEAPARSPSSFATAGGDPQIGVSEALLFSNSKKIARELLADRPGSSRRASRACRRTGRDHRPGRSERALSRRPTTKKSAPWRVSRRAHRQARRRPSRSSSGYC